MESELEEKEQRGHRNVEKKTLNGFRTELILYYLYKFIIYYIYIITFIDIFIFMQTESISKLIN